jgi:hypothetical protein
MPATVLTLVLLCITARGAQLSLSPAQTSASAEEVIVNVGEVLNNTRHHPLGINLDYLMDDDRNPLLAPKHPLREALRELGTKYLRYPGGWKSAINLWSTPPYTASHATLAGGRVPESWIRTGVQLTSPDGSWRLDPLDFDEFMELCRDIQAEPCLVIPYESCYWQMSDEWKPPSKESLLETAAAWVRYANRRKDYNVRYWEIGNESWLSNETWTNGITPETYAVDLVEFAKRMKAEDPSILVGANGDSDRWWQIVLSRGAKHIDFLSVHTYPCWKWRNYDEYRTNNFNGLGAVHVATAAITKYAPTHAKRLRIMLTEFAAGTFGDWDKTPADLGRALMTFDLQGQLLQCRDVYFSQFWNTHNIYSDVDGGVFDALKKDNTLSPVGRALWIWSRFLGDAMVATSTGESIRCFATYGPERRLAILLVNKEASARRVHVTLQHAPAKYTKAAQWVLYGSSPQDGHPTWEQRGEPSLQNGGITSLLEPVSITVIAVTPADSSARSASGGSAR